MTVFQTRTPASVPLPVQDPAVPYPTDRWPTGSAPDGIVDALDQLLESGFADEDLGRTLAFVAIHRGRLVAERYGPTAGPDESLISWSMAKSFTHALLGVLIADGKLDHLAAAPVPEWADTDDPRSAITIDQLLRMVPGTLFNEDYLDENTSHCIDMLFGDGKVDMGAYTAALPLVDRPGTHFNYSSGTSVLLCRILADIVGRGPDFEAWMNRVLLEPLGIDASLTFDDAGTWVGSSFLNATARDFAKFGLLYLRDGVWDGSRLLPAGWVDYARTPQAADEDGGVYGAHWWIWSAPQEVFFAAGYETQRILVDPAADLVLVRLGKTPTEQADNVDRWLEEIRLLFSSGSNPE